MSITYRQLRKRLYATDFENGKHGRLLSRKERLELVNFTCRTLAIRMRLVALGAGRLAAVNGKNNPRIFQQNKSEAYALHNELQQLQADGYTSPSGNGNLIYNCSPYYAAAKYKTEVGTIYHILRVYAKTGAITMPGDHDYKKPEKPINKKPEPIKTLADDTPCKQGDDHAALNCAGRTLQPLSAHLNDVVTISTACSRLLTQGVPIEAIDLATVEYYRDEPSDDAPPLSYSTKIKRNIVREVLKLESQFREICASMSSAQDEISKYAYSLQLDKKREAIALLKQQIRRTRKRSRKNARKARIVGTSHSVIVRSLVNRLRFA